MDIEKHKALIITHVLNVGSRRAIAWLRDTYTPEEIADVIKKSTITAWDKESLALWSLVCDVTPKKSRFV